MSDPFAAYALPKAVLDGAEIALEGTPAVFKVRLPSNLDEEFQAKTMQRLSMDTTVDPETGVVRSNVNAMKLQAVRRELFFEMCILEAKGLPKNMEVADFFEKYPLAARDVFTMATDMAMEMDQEAEDALGKLKTTPSGKISGQAA